jgi:hypothetical protein
MRERNFKSNIKGEKTMKMLKIMNHNLSDAQMKELKDVWNVTEIVTLSDKGIKSFEQVTAENYNNVINEINREIAEIDPDIMLIQGQAGVVHNVINSNPEVTAIFAFTRRISKEMQNPDGTVTKTSIFEHQKFMKY